MQRRKQVKRGKVHRAFNEYELLLIILWPVFRFQSELRPHIIWTHRHTERHTVRGAFFPWRTYRLIKVQFDNTRTLQENLFFSLEALSSSRKASRMPEEALTLGNRSKNFINVSISISCPKRQSWGKGWRLKAEEQLVEETRHEKNMWE